jgi:hypothetical protein
MRIDSSDIVNKILSYKNYHGLSYEKMAVLCGYSGKSGFAKIIKSQNLTIKYLMNFLNNANIDISEFFKSFTFVNNDVNNSNESTPPYKIKCTNEDCLKEMNELISQINYLQNQNSKLIDIVHQLSKKGDISLGEPAGGVA